MHIFITRHLTESSPFRQLLQAAGHEVCGVSLLEFRKVPVAHVPASDIIFFYSRNAVRFFMGQWQPPTPAPQMACIGSSTAQALREAGYPPSFVGQGQPQDVAQQFLPHCQWKSVLFPRARHSKKSIQQALEQKEVTLLDLIVYDNTPRHHFPQPQAEALAFTSPMNAQAYFQKYPHQGEYVISIGSSTTAALQALGIRKVYQSAEPSEAALAAIILEI